MSENCPICGHDDKACTGDTRQVITTSGVVKTNAPPRVPIQKTRIGKAGYQGKVELYDPSHPNLRLVQHGDEEPDPDATALMASVEEGEEAASKPARPAAGEDAAPKRKRKAKE